MSKKLNQLIYLVVIWIPRLIYLNLLWFIFSLPLITIVKSSRVLILLQIQYKKKFATTSVAKDFWNFFSKKNIYSKPTDNLYSLYIVLFVLNFLNFNRYQNDNISIILYALLTLTSIGYLLFFYQMMYSSYFKIEYGYFESFIIMGNSLNSVFFLLITNVTIIFFLTLLFPFFLFFSGITLITLVNIYIFSLATPRLNNYK